MQIYLEKSFKGRIKIYISYQKNIKYEDSCPEFGFQAFEQMCEDFQIDSDYTGYCLFWNIFLLDLRLINLQINIKTLQEYYIAQYLNEIGISKDSDVINLSRKFREFIRNYSSFIHSMVSPKYKFYSPK